MEKWFAHLGPGPEQQGKVCRQEWGMRIAELPDEVTPVTVIRQMELGYIPGLHLRELDVVTIIPVKRLVDERQAEEQNQRCQDENVPEYRPVGRFG